MSSFTSIKRLKFWCQKVLPLVYDDSLSYYEVLCKIKSKLNELIDGFNSLDDYIDDAITERLSDEHIIELMGQFIQKIESAISANNEGDNTNSDNNYSIGELLWLNDTLYKVIRTIDAGDTFIVDTNIEEVNFEDLFNNFIDEVKHDITANDDGVSTTATQDWNNGDWLWLDNVLYVVTTDITEGTAYVFTGNNANVKQITVEEMNEIVYYPNDKKLSVRGKISDYSQIVTVGDYHVYTPNVETISIMHNN